MATQSDLMAAEEIKAILHGRDKTEQERIIHWVTESLALAAVPNAIAVTPAPPVAVPAVTPAHEHTAVTPPHRPKDIKTFVNEKIPKSEVQFAAVAAYFYRFESSPGERKEVILPQDSDQVGRQARGYDFKKARATLNNAVMLGYFDRAGDGQFKLNAVGENPVALTLPGACGEANGGKARGPKRKRKARENRCESLV